MNANQISRIRSQQANNYMKQQHCYAVAICWETVVACAFIPHGDRYSACISYIRSWPWPYHRQDSFAARAVTMYKVLYMPACFVSACNDTGALHHQLGSWIMESQIPRALTERRHAHSIMAIPSHYHVTIFMEMRA